MLAHVAVLGALGLTKSSAVSSKVESRGYHKLTVSRAPSLPFDSKAQWVPAGGSYFVDIEIVLLDTGSDILWVPSSNSSACEEDICAGGQFKANASSSFLAAKDSRPFNVTYDDGSQELGIFASDMVGLGDISVPNFTFGLANKVQVSPLTPNGPQYGILGISYNSPTFNCTSVNDPTTCTLIPTVIDRMYDSGVIDSRSYSIYLDDVQEQKGNIVFGAIDTAKFSGDLVTMDVVKRPGGYVGQMLYLTSATLVADGTFKSSPLAHTPYEGLLDTGSNYLQVPSTVFQQFVRQIPESAFASSLDGTAVYCDQAKTSLGLVLGFKDAQNRSANIEVPFREMLTPIFNNGDVYNSSWSTVPLTQNGRALCDLSLAPSFSPMLILGDPLLRSAYTFYNLNEHTISIAQPSFFTDKENIVTVGKGPTPHLSGLGEDSIAGGHVDTPDDDLDTNSDAQGMGFSQRREHQASAAGDRDCSTVERECPCVPEDTCQACKTSSGLFSPQCVNFYQRLQIYSCLPSVSKSIGLDTARELSSSTDLDSPLLSKLMVDTSACDAYEHQCPKAHKHDCKSCQRAAKASDKDRKDDEKYRKMIKECNKFAKQLCEDECVPDADCQFVSLNGSSIATAQGSRSTASDSLLSHPGTSDDDSVCDQEHQLWPEAHEWYCKDCMHTLKSLLKDRRDDEKQEWKKCIKHDHCLPTDQCQQLSSPSSPDSRGVFDDTLSEDFPDPRTPVEYKPKCKQLKKHCYDINGHDCRKCARAYEEHLKFSNSPQIIDKHDRDCTEFSQQFRRSGWPHVRQAVGDHLDIDQSPRPKEFITDVKLIGILQNFAASSSCDKLASRCSDVSETECEACQTALIGNTSWIEVKEGCMKFTEQLCADQGECSGLTESQCATDLQLLRDMPNSPPIPEQKAVFDGIDVEATTLEAFKTSDLSPALLEKKQNRKAMTACAELLSNNECVTTEGCSQCTSCAVRGEGCEQCQAALHRCELDYLLPLFAPLSASLAIVTSAASAVSTLTEVTVETTSAPLQKKDFIGTAADLPCNLLSCKEDAECCEGDGEAPLCLSCQHHDASCKEFYEQFNLCQQDGDVLKFPGLLDEAFTKSNSSTDTATAMPTLIERNEVSIECNHSATMTGEMSLTASTSSDQTKWHYTDPPSPTTSTREPVEPRFEDWPCDSLGSLHCYAATGACSLCKMSGNGCELFNALLTKCSKIGEGNNDLALLFPGLSAATEREHISPSTGSDGPSTTWSDADPTLTEEYEWPVYTNPADLYCGYLAVANCYEAAAACTPCKIHGFGCDEYNAFLSLCAEENDWNDDEEDLMLKFGA
ncbi:hypothetical protein AC578_803 [Pseudocercospora eumusae]|uniref:Peptidase A1 domain-containing protein n=1 Tax=Pseudocercospora eumusae TaxID=321146 RepID=A0A139HC31_9PEZI|nr:hypothetical protein AC578_803 [Pseudocercospora eumusae]